MKVILNKCYGGFGVSVEAAKLYESKTGNRISVYCEEYRDDPILVSIVESLGEKANGPAAKLKVVEIPDDLDYVIDDYDGIETLHERVRCW